MSPSFSLSAILRRDAARDVDAAARERHERHVAGECAVRRDEQIERLRRRARPAPRAPNSVIARAPLSVASASLDRSDARAARAPLSWRNASMRTSPAPDSTRSYDTRGYCRRRWTSSRSCSSIDGREIAVAGFGRVHFVVRPVPVQHRHAEARARTDDDTLRRARPESRPAA